MIYNLHYGYGSGDREINRKPRSWTQEKRDAAKAHRALADELDAEADKLEAEKEVLDREYGPAVYAR